MRESDLRIAAGKWDSDNGIISRKLLIFLISLQDKIQQSTFVLRPGTLMKNRRYLPHIRKSDGTRREVIYILGKVSLFMRKCRMSDLQPLQFPLPFYTVHISKIKWTVNELSFKNKQKKALRIIPKYNKKYINISSF